MLVIRRKAGESLLIGEQVEIEVLSIEGGQVKLGIRAPRSILILRKEVLWASVANRSAALTEMPKELENLLGRLRKSQP